MVSRVKVGDIAREAGVSSATVDRVLNDRDGVSARTREIVRGTARRLGYLPGSDQPDAPVRSGTVHEFVFLLPAGTNTFIKTLGRQIEAQAATREMIRVRVETFEGFNPQLLAARIAALPATVAGVGLIAQDHPLIRDAIRALVRRGCEVLTLASDIQNVPRLAYVGIDNRAAGRLAGHLMGKLLGQRPAAKVALFAGSMSYRGHEEREMGFRAVLREDFPMVQIVDTREILDDRQTAQHEATQVLAQHPDILGIYNVGGGTFGIAEAIKAKGARERLVLIGHEATAGNKQLLLDGLLDAVIDQNPRVEAREALNILTAAAEKQPYVFVPPRIQVVFKENLPED